MLVALVRAPERRSGAEAVRGRRVFEAERVVDAVEGRWDGRGFTARRTAGGWEVDGQAAPPPASVALDDLVTGLVDLRALDAFRPRDQARFGLDAPRGTIALWRGDRVQRLAIGDMNAAGSAFYARLEGETRVLQVGSGLTSSLERVLFVLGRQRPETG